MTPSRDIGGLIEILAALRDPVSGCAWDLKQTHRSLARYLLEEAYEGVEAINGGSDADLCAELGDVLLQVVFHARIAAERQAFDFGDVVRGIATKLVRRHPHIFGSDERPASDSAAALRWEALKAQERSEAGGGAPTGLLDGVATALPGLDRAVKLQARASTVGFDWNDRRHVLAKIREEVDEIEAELDGSEAGRLESEIGDLLFAVANLARHAGADPEAAIRAANAKFLRRFGYIEQRLLERGSSPEESNLDEMDALWNEAKQAGL